MYILAIYCKRQKKYKPYILRPVHQHEGLTEYPRTFFWRKRDAIEEAKKYSVPCRVQVWTYSFKNRTKNLTKTKIVFEQFKTGYSNPKQLTNN